MQTYYFKDIVKGDTFKGLSFAVEVNETPLDLTDAAVDIWFRSGSKTGTIEKVLSSNTGGITITDDVGGVFQIDPFTVNLAAGTYFYDIQITFPDNTVKTYVDGTMKVIQDVTG
jgi:hypothetical protein